MRAWRRCWPRAETLSPEQRDELRACLADHRATKRSAALDAQAPASDASQRLHALAQSCQQLAAQADFSFLYHRKRHLFHIGWRVAEQELDAGFYDLLASESRLTSLFALAKGDVPVRHWASLGRPFFAAGADAGLRSWSGSMFEYLMPTLVLDEPQGSVLNQANRAALREQIAYADAQQLPWGISESAYAGSDHTLAYQYAPQGVPRLALRRTPADEMVIAPYATALAAQIAPRRACRNFRALQALGARGRYGFIEALDFTPARQAGSAACTPVQTFMAHHQGMSIVALANVLLDGTAQRWGSASAAIEAVASLLHERAPREVSPLPAAADGPPVLVRERRASGLLREVLPGEAAVEPTHLLSNGRYGVALRANGAGLSRWGATGITRWRDDALRDAYGSFFYLRWPEGTHKDAPAQPVSITQHPAPDPAAHYRSSFHADRVCFDAAWPGVQAHTTVWVSPEDDIEFRQVEISNLGERTLEIELLSAFEVTLSDARADEAHPAFMNLFVRAEWQPAAKALWFERKPRLPTEAALRMAHFLADSEAQIVDIRVLAERQRWLGRNRDASQPLADFGAPAPASGAPQALDTGLDPVCAMAVRLRIAPLAKARLTFATAASDNDGTLRAVIDKYRQPSHVQRASLMSATLAGIRLRTLRVSAETFAAIQTLSTALVLSLTRPPSASGHGDTAGREVCDRRLLWRFGISGDRPLLLVSAAAMHDLGLLRSLAQGLRLWSWGGIACDLVVVNSEGASYQMALQRELIALRDRHSAESAAQPGLVATAMHVLRRDELSDDELSTLRHLARVHLRADGRALLHHVQAWIAAHDRALEQRLDVSTTALAEAPDTASVAGRIAGRVRGRIRRVPLRCRRGAAAGAPVDQRAVQPRLRRADLRSRRRLQLGGEQPHEPAHRLVERRGRRPAQRTLPDPRPPQPGAVVGGAGQPQRRAGRRVRLPRRPWPGLHADQPPPRQPAGQRVLVRGPAQRRQAGAAAPGEPRPPHAAPAHCRHRRMDDGRQPQRPRHGAHGAVPPAPAACARGRRPARRRASPDRAAVHAARARRRLRRRHGLLRAGRRRRRGRGLDLRPPRTLRCARPSGAARPSGPTARQRPGPVRGIDHTRHAGGRRHGGTCVPAGLWRPPRRGAPAGHHGRGGRRDPAAGPGARPLGRSCSAPPR